MFLFGVFAAAALLLASVGIYGVIAYSIAQRTHEFGLRLALGADRPTVAGMVVEHGLRIAGAGLVLGFVAATAVTQILGNLLYDVTPTDPTTFAIVAGVVSVAALAATLIPARRAARIDPLMALRAE